MDKIEIQLPAEFSPVHESTLTAYLAGTLHGREQWRTLFTAVDLLANATITEGGKTRTFHQLYQTLIDDRLADEYIRQLLILPNVVQDSPALWAFYARQITQIWHNHYKQMPSLRLLLVYWLYWWNAFARGYAFEVEIFHDLTHSGIQFEAHDLSLKQERFSPGDLKIGSLLGDIKSSLYFVRLKSISSHDFFIVRLYIGRQRYTIAVLLKEEVWTLFNGDVLFGNWDTLSQNLSSPVKIETGNMVFVALDFDEWKRRVRRWQGEIATNDNSLDTDE
ncbi:MAG: hypothetical protein KDD89_02370 [Anaerolineales bacterium]|nr:hypothetical protein [Anaerolineales bacterium]